MIKIGTSGFSFDDWKETIYPAGLAKEKWLAFYEQELGFKALEVNFTYYSLPSAKSCYETGIRQGKKPTIRLLL
jgi:uncharacterized protein YecE (DUF72 family)